MKNSHFISHLFNVLGVRQLTLRDSLARALTTGRLFCHQERRPELSSSEFIVELKQIVHIRRLTSQHARRSRLFVTQRIRFPASLIHFLVLRDERRPRARATYVQNRQSSSHARASRLASPPIFHARLCTAMIEGNPNKILPARARPIPILSIDPSRASSSPRIARAHRNRRGRRRTAHAHDVLLSRR